MACTESESNLIKTTELYKSVSVQQLDANTADCYVRFYTDEAQTQPYQLESDALVTCDQTEAPWQSSGYYTSFSHSLDRQILVSIVRPKTGTTSIQYADSPLSVTSATTIDLSGVFNSIGITTPGVAFSATGGFDNSGYTFPSTCLSTSVVAAGVPFSLGTPNANNILRSTSGPTISLPSGSFSRLWILASAALGNQLSQTSFVTYTNGNSTAFTLNFSDWARQATYAGENFAATCSYRNTHLGGSDIVNAPYHVYAYPLTLNSTKTVQSLTLPINSNLLVMAITLVP